MVNLNDAFDDEPREPFRIEKSALYGSVIGLGHLNIFLSSIRLAELHAVIGAALEANPEAPEAQAPAADGPFAGALFNELDAAVDAAEPVYQELA